MPPNIWRADYGFCEVPPTLPTFSAIHPAPSFPGPPAMAPMFCRPAGIPVHLLQPIHKPKKCKKTRKSEVAFVPAPMLCLPKIPQLTGPVPYPTLQPVLCTAPNETGTRRCGCHHCLTKGTSSSTHGGYKKISYSGPWIPLHILRRGTKTADIADGHRHYFQMLGVDFVQRSYQDNMSFKQFVADFAGKGDWIVTQVRELGEGRWEKAISIDVGSDKGKKTMAEVGWTSDRGPVWVVIEKKTGK